MDLCTKLSDRVLDLETTKTTQANEIASLKRRVKKMERKRKSKSPRMNLFKIGTSRRISLGEEDASKQGRNLKQGKQSLIFEDKDFDEEFDANMDEDIEQFYDANKYAVEEGETLMKMRSEKSKARGVVMKEPTQMQAKLEEEERLAIEREEDANIAEWDNVQAMMDVDYELAARIQAQEHEELTIEEKSKMFIDSFVPVDYEVVKGSKDRAEGNETRAEGSSKRAGEDLQ
ncbi:hypothetical protein Tco_1371865 [Tanacetum coccineum]